ncbi:uncharacterized protein LDX57_004723 [Aspergillus melleus]|uniref:uncharacterized protein n=1 Tax=Aspergillus melleus TaxID=138277 RepID=UPI001E8E716F|nr:uncharacterized protein LDX57_004723 [Aspergillus melleus]KAH8427002.1 hypothetical protein LDX57_004723 [Aspergillus melleus]
MLDVVIRERYVLDTIRAPEDFAHEKAHEAAGSATLSELPNGDVAFGNPKGLETLAHASQFEEIHKELGDLKQELAKVNEKLRDHDRLLGDSRSWMTVRNRIFLTFLRYHSKKGSSFISRLVDPFGSKQKQQIKECNKLIHEADMVTDMRMVKMCPESSEYHDGFDMFDMYEMIYSCSLSVAECLEANRMTYAIKTIDQIASYGLSEEHRMSRGQGKAAKELELYLQGINPGKGIAPEEALKLQSICDAFQAAKE